MGNNYVSISNAQFFSNADEIFSNDLVALLWTHPTELQAQVAIDEIVVTSNRIPIPARQLGTSVSVLDFEGIESRGTLALADVIRQMPAVAASSNGGLGNATTLRIRGEEGFRTLTYLDGMRLQDPSAPQIATDFSNLISCMGNSFASVH